ncbi:hypothetical protein KC19_7G185300 [Ceratodon purpureus]|uniref:J domain-containing protein n=1 Tax=Ceratodon purpureus TaxID=3225 RepID=A0A8T0HB10_CERPU|nr:hypothetical protein KC19_7G185300 [Ceratodon purpureus]
MESPRRSSLDFQEQCQSEEVEAKRWMDRASRYLTEGRFESAIRLLEKTENVFPGCKNLPELIAVTQVCYAATWRSCHCARPHTRKLPDWYHVLKVDERADFDTIKKRYRQLALLLHPDKNKHVNSEAAFKIITEAYACLSDKEKRDLFNLERRRSFCANCNLKAQLHAAGHTVHSAGHTPRPVAKVRIPRTPKSSNACGTPKSTPKSWEADSLQNLRERAKTTVNNLEREWGTKTSKWMQQLASVRVRYWNLNNSSVTAKSRSTMKPDPWTPPRSQEHAPRSKAHMHPDGRHTMSHMNSTPNGMSGSKQDFDTFEVRRASTGGVHDVKLEEDLDLLLKKLRADGSASSKGSPLFKDFVVHTRTPEAGHLARPLFVKRVTRSSSVDRKCSLNDAGPTYAMCMPRGRCVSKKDPFSPSALKTPSAVRVNRSMPRKYSSELKGQSTPQTEMHSKEAYYSTPGRSSSLRFENIYQSSLNKEDVAQPGSRSVARTASGSWTSRVKANPELFDDVFTTVNTSTLRTPIRRQTPGSYTTEAFVLRTPPGERTSDASPEGVSQSSKLSDQSRKIVEKGSPSLSERMISSTTEKNASLSSRLYNHSSTADAEGNQEIRPPCGMNRTENMSSFRVNSNMTCNIERGRNSQLEDIEQKQKSDAINGILERLRAEAKTVAASLDRLRENIAVENVTTRV